jgi:hypothetical protein
MGTQRSAGSNPPAGGSSASQTVTNPPAGGSPTQTPAPGAPAADAGSNSQAEGSSDPQAPSAENDENTPVARARFNEVARSEALLRKERTELRARLQKLEDAQLSDQERDKKRLTEAEAQVQETARANQGLRLQIAIADYAREHGLQDPAAIKSLLMDEHRDDLADDPDLENIAHYISLVVEKHPVLAKSSTPQPPSSGRSVSPPRTSSGQYTQRQEEPKPPKEWKPLGALTKEDWDKLGGNSGQ